MNFYGMDKKMHRGLLIVRSDLTTEVIRSFNTSLQHRFRIAKMKNPNVYDGNDPRQMEANNTSAFNCRQVVGNYKLSPLVRHLDRRQSGAKPLSRRERQVVARERRALHRPHPISGRHAHQGLLPDQKLRSYDFFWGGFWYPGRDYQHFEYRG